MELEGQSGDCEHDPFRAADRVPVKRSSWLLTLGPLAVSACGAAVTDPQDGDIGSSLNGQVRQVATEVLIKNVQLRAAGQR